LESTLFKDACIVISQAEALYSLEKRFFNIFPLYFYAKLWTPLGAPVLDWGHGFYNFESTLFEGAYVVIWQIDAL